MVNDPKNVRERGVELRRGSVGLQIVSLFAGREFTEVEKVIEVVHLTAGDQLLS